MACRLRPDSPSRKPRRCLALLPVVLLTVAAAPRSPQGEEPVPSPLIEREEVRFVTLDLSVEEKRERRWRRPRDLRLEQITVEVGGIPVTLELFENWCRPVAAGETPEPDPFQAGVEASRPGEDRIDTTGPVTLAPESLERSTAANIARYILYFDLTHLNMEGLHLSMKAALEWSDTQAKPDDEVMIVTGGRGLRIFRPMWPARDGLREDILALRESSPIVESWAVLEDFRIREILDLRTRSLRRQLANSYAALDFMHTRNALENLEGLMTLFEGLEGTKNLIFFQDTIRQFPGEIYTQVTNVTQTYPFLHALATAANERNIRIYPVHASGLQVGAGIGVNDALSMLASETGGRYIHGTNRIATVIERAGEDATCFYRVGFRVRPRFSGGTARIAVRIEGNRYRVRHRRTLHDPTRSERDRDQLRAAFLDPDAAASFPVNPVVSMLHGDADSARVRFQVSVARSDLLDLAAGATGSEARQLRVQAGGTVLPLVSDLTKDVHPTRGQAWSDVDHKRKVWSFARQSVLRISHDDRQLRDLMLVQEVELPVGDYRLVAVVQDQLARTISAGKIDFTVEPTTDPIGRIRLAYIEATTLPIEEPRDDRLERRHGKRNGEPVPLPSSLPAGSVLARDSTFPAGREAWLVYSLCDPSGNKGEPQFAGWAIDRVLVCNNQPSPAVTVPIPDPEAGDSCIVLVDPLSSSMPAGACETQVTVHRPGSPPATSTLSFHVLPGRGALDEPNPG